MVAVPGKSHHNPHNCVLTSAELLPILKSVDTQAEFLGPLLVEENLLVPEQLDLALKFAESTGLPLDQIVVAEFAVPQPDISRLLSQLNGDATEETEVEPAVIVPPVPPLGFRIRRPIGQIFVDLGFITTDDREAALEVQRESGALLGEILVEQGKLTRLELANALSEHWASFTTDSVSPPEHKPSLTVISPSNGSAPSSGVPDTAELRRSLDELEAARVADAQAAGARIAAIDEALAALVPSDDEEFRHAMTERLQELARRVEAAESGSTGAIDLVAQLDELARSTSELRSELEVLASRPAEVDSSERVSELKQTIDALAETLDDRLATLAAELRAENDIRTDEIAARLRAQTEELAASVAVSRVDDLNEMWRADADAARLANDELREKLDELVAVRAIDIESTKAAQAQATQLAAETARIEHALRSELEALASLQAETEPDESVNELKQTIHALTQTTDERIAMLATELRAETGTRTDDIRRVDGLKRTVDAIAKQLKTQTESVERARTADAKAAKTANARLSERLDELLVLRATDAEATQAAAAEAAAAAAEAVRIEQALRSELDAVAARQAEAEPAESVKELAHTIDALAQAMDGRLATLAAELRVETAAGTENAVSHVLTQTDKLATSVDAIREAAAGKQAEIRQIGERLADDSRSLAARVDELVGRRADDVEAAQVAQEWAAAEICRVEQGLMASLAELAVQVADLEDRLAQQPVARDSEPLLPDDEPSTTISGDRDPKIKKHSKRDKRKKKPKH